MEGSAQIAESQEVEFLSEDGGGRSGGSGEGRHRYRTSHWSRGERKMWGERELRGKARMRTGVSGLWEAAQIAESQEVGYLSEGGGGRSGDSEEGRHR